MPEIEFTPSQKTIIVEPGGLLLDALRSANIELDAQCGGKGVCGKCRVRIMKGSVVFDARVSAGTMDAQDVEKGYVLACSTKVGVDDLVVFVPEQNCGSDRYQDPECQEDQQGYRQEHVLLPGNLEYDPLVRAIHLIIPEAKPEDGLSDLDRVRSAILDYTKCDDVEFPLSVVRTLADTVREENGSVTVTLFSYPETSKGSGEIDRVLRVAAGSLQEPLYGIAVDVGTTSISVRLVELRSGRIAATAGDYNDQIPCGQDVISRIIYSGGQGRLKELRSRVLGTVNRLIGICIEIASDQDPVEINHGDIVCAVISGNTTMTHLFLGMKPEYIRLEPYTPTVLHVPRFIAQEIGLHIHPETPIIFSPAVGSYVGGDITSGLLHTGIAWPDGNISDNEVDEVDEDHVEDDENEDQKEDDENEDHDGDDINEDHDVCEKDDESEDHDGDDINEDHDKYEKVDASEEKDEMSLYLDIGTNGELVIGNRDFLVTCACSAGPAFEGGGLACGMRATSGAIDRVTVDPGTGQCSYHTIGDAAPLGLCGSGIISLLSALFRTDWLDAGGKLRNDLSSASITGKGRVASYMVVPEGESGTGEAIVIDETEISSVLRAKAAIYSACSLVVESLGLIFDEISHVYIGGGFGHFLNLEDAITIGLIPDLPRNRFSYIGNASLIGSAMMLMSRECLDRQKEIAGMMTYLELSTTPEYMDQYTAALFLPHTDSSRFPSVKKDQM